VHIVVKTHPSISFYSCPNCLLRNQDSADREQPECRPPPAGTCVPLDTSPDSIFEVRARDGSHYCSVDRASRSWPVLLTTLQYVRRYAWFTSSQLQLDTDHHGAHQAENG
jgi:hypothetical protein